MKINPFRFKNLCLFLLGTSATGISAQIQLNIGYGILNTKPAALNQVISTYNSSYDRLVAPMGALKSMEGIHAEIAFVADPLSVGLEWQNLSRDMTNRYTLASDPTKEIANKIRFVNDMLSVHAGVMLLRNIGIGVTGDLNVNQIKKRSSADTKYSTLLLYKTQLSSRFYLHINFPLTDWMALGVRPYVRIPWNSIDYKPVVSRLSLTMPDNATLGDRKMDFGIQFVWQNFLSPRQSAEQY